MATVPFMIFCGTFLGVAAGYIMHRADFCLTAMFRDLFLFKATFKLRILLLLIIFSMLLFEVAHLAGLISIYPFPLFGSPSLTAPLGGMIFGIGMVLAGGCVVGSLYKAGAGSVPSLVAIIGLVLGSALFAEFFPWWSRVNSAATFFKGKATVPQLLGVHPSLLIAAAAAIALPFLISSYRSGKLVRTSFAEGSMQPWLAAILLSIIGLISVIAIGMPLGITTSYAKAAAIAESAVCPEHFAGLKFFQTMPLKYTQPITGEVLTGGPGNSLDGISLIQFPLIFGIVAGSALSALLLKEFTIRWRLPLRQYLSVAIGGILMGLASRMAAGCNVWHLLGGLPIMVMQSMLFLAGLFPGAWLGAKLLSRYVIR